MTALSTRTVVGSASSSYWSQVHIFHPTGENIKSYGSLLVALCVTSREGDEDIASVGAGILDELHEAYYLSDSSRDTKGDAIYAIVGEIVEKYRGVLVDGVVGVCRNDEQHMQQELVCYSFGNANGFLGRSGKVYRLFGDAAHEESGSVVRKITGVLQLGDLFVLATSSFFTAVLQKDIVRSFHSGDLDEAGSVLAPLVQNSAVADRIAALVVGLLSAEEQVGDNTERDSEDRLIVESQPRFQMVQLFEKLSRIFRFFQSIKGSGLSRLNGLRKPQSVQDVDITVRDGSERKSRLMYSLAFAMLVLLGVSILFGWRHRKEQVRKERFLEVWEVVDHQYSEAMSLVELNPLRAKSLFGEAKNGIEKGMNDSREVFDSQQMEQLDGRLQDITTALSDLSGERVISEPSVYLDLSLVRPDTRGDRMALDGDVAVVLDRSSGVVIRVNLGNKSAETVGGGSFLVDSSLVSVQQARGFVLSNSGIVEILMGNKTSAVVIEYDSSWGELIDMESFGANLYLLDRANGMIYRYQGAEGGFGEKKNWLTEPSSALIGAESMAIDGDVWVLTREDVLRFRQGREENFRLVGLETPFQDPVQMFTDSNSAFVYVLDRGNKRVVVFDKDSGEYEEQYLWDGIQSVSDLVVLEESATMYLLSENLLYAIPLSRE